MMRRGVLQLALALAVAGATFGVRADTLPGMSVYRLGSPWTTQDGKTVSLSSLRGHPVIVAMIYLKCPDICPLIAENMLEIGAHLPKTLAPDVRFALFTFDPVQDSPAKLRAYAVARGLDLRRWTLLHSNENATRDLAAALEVSYKKRDNGDFDHSVAIVLLDRDGVVAYRQTGISDDTGDFVAQVTRLLRATSRGGHP
jgi:protein SCO1/2